MIAYKFRSPNKLEFTLDILLNNRLYCSDWKVLNDPMEGIFAYDGGDEGAQNYTRILEAIGDEKRKLRICSLSETFNDHLLWSHYADGFRGLAVEVDIPDGDIVNVNYDRGVFAHIGRLTQSDPQNIARAILSSKYHVWSYEKEVRILSESSLYALGTPVRRIVVGHRMEPSVFQALQIICQYKKIKVDKIVIRDEGIDAEEVPALAAP